MCFSNIKCFSNVNKVVTYLCIFCIAHCTRGIMVVGFWFIATNISKLNLRMYSTKHVFYFNRIIAKLSVLYGVYIISPAGGFMKYATFRYTIRLKWKTSLSHIIDVPSNELWQNLATPLAPQERSPLLASCCIGWVSSVQFHGQLLENVSWPPYWYFLPSICALRQSPTYSK